MFALSGFITPDKVSQEPRESADKNFLGQAADGDRHLSILFSEGRQGATLDPSVQIQGEHTAWVLPWTAAWAQHQVIAILPEYRLYHSGSFAS